MILILIWSRKTAFYDSSFICLFITLTALNKTNKDCCSFIEYYPCRELYHEGISILYFRLFRNIVDFKM